MEENTTHRGSEFIPDINFYRYAAYSCSNRDKNPSLAFNETALRMNSNQFAYSQSFIRDLRRRHIKPEELMLIDSFCEFILGTPVTLAINRLMLNDEYIANVYADIMDLRNRINPNYETRPSVSDLFNLILAVSDNNDDNPFTYSELDHFLSKKDETAQLMCIGNGCSPIYSQNGVCVGQRLFQRNSAAASGTAIIYASGSQDREAFSDLLGSNRFTFSSATAEICETRDIFIKLTQTYHDFCINTSTLPQPQSERYARRVYSRSELSTAKLCEAFFTEEVFGDKVILIHGNKSSLRKICNVAKRQGLSYFNGITIMKKPHRAYRDPDSPELIKIKSLLYHRLCEMCDNMTVILPEHDTLDRATSDILPETNEILRVGDDLFISSNVKLSQSPLPFHSGFLALLTPVIHARSLRKEPEIGQARLSVRISLCFDDQKNAGISISALLGLFDAARRLSIPITSSELNLTESGNMGITVTVHDFSDHIQSSSEKKEEIHRLLLEKIDLSDLGSIDLLLKNRQ